MHRMKLMSRSGLFLVSGGLLAWQILYAVAAISVFGAAPSLSHVIAFLASGVMFVAGPLSLVWPRVSAWLAGCSAIAMLPYFIPLLPQIFRPTARLYDGIPFALLLLSIGVVVRSFPETRVDSRAGMV